MRNFKLFYGILLCILISTFGCRNEVPSAPAEPSVIPTKKPKSVPNTPKPELNENKSTAIKASEDGAQVNHKNETSKIKIK